MIEMSVFTFFDAVVLAVVVLSAIAGFRRGFVTEVLSLAAWGGAILLTVYGLKPLIDVVRETVQPDVVADAIAFVGLFVGGLIVLKLLAAWIGSTVRTSFIGPLDRAAGTVFGVLRGALVVSFIYLLYSHWVPQQDQPESIQNAQLHPLVQYGAEMLAILGPELLERAPDGDDTDAILKSMKDNMPTSTFINDSGYAEEIRDEMKQKVLDSLKEVPEEKPADKEKDNGTS